VSPVVRLQRAIDELAREPEIGIRAGARGGSGGVDLEMFEQIPTPSGGRAGEAQ